jgi:hypothetical protein
LRLDTRSARAGRNGYETLPLAMVDTRSWRCSAITVKCPPVESFVESHAHAEAVCRCNVDPCLLRGLGHEACSLVCGLKNIMPQPKAKSTPLKPLSARTSFSR